jgi:hypothetical protein
MGAGVNRGDLLVIVPTRGRPANALRLREAVLETAPGVELRFGVDDDDPALDEYRAAKLPMHVGPRLGMCGTLNALAVDHAPFRPYLGFLGDDHLPRGPWAEPICEALEELGTGIVYGNDLFQGPNLPTAVFMTSDIVRSLGYMAPPTLRHLFLDSCWLDWGRALDRIRYLPEVVIEHMHPQAGKAAWDGGYHECNGGAMWEHDETAYAEYKASGQFDADVERIRSAAGVRA